MAEKRHPCPKDHSHEVTHEEYPHDVPEHYDGVSEIHCLDCGKRYGRWTGKELAEGEKEPRFGIPRVKKETTTVTPA
jgi:hypothetical protein